MSDVNIAAKPLDRPFAVRSGLAVLITLLVTACSPTPHPVRTSDRAIPAAPPRAATVVIAATASPTVTSYPTLTALRPGSEAARAAMAKFESAWCCFRWDEPPAVRLARARAYMTPVAAARLRVAIGWWVGQIRTSRTVATCTGVRVFQVDAPSDGSRTVLRAVMVRTSRDLATGRSSTQQVTDERWLVNAGGRWLVDAVTEGG